MPEQWRWNASPPAVHAVTLLEQYVQPFQYGDDDCWPWLGTIKPSGYGSFSGVPAYRVVFELLVDDLPPVHPTTGARLVLDHLCENRTCVNPKHLMPTSYGVNIQWVKRIGFGSRTREQHFDARTKLPWYTLDVLQRLKEYYIANDAILSASEGVQSPVSTRRERRPESGVVLETPDTSSDGDDLSGRGSSAPSRV